MTARLLLRGRITELLCLIPLALVSCKKDDDKPYLKRIKYEATCNTCQVNYVIGTTEIYDLVTVSWQRSFDIHQAQYLKVRVIDPDTIGTSTAKVFVNGALMYSASNTGALDTLVQAAGYP